MRKLWYGMALITVLAATAGTATAATAGTAATAAAAPAASAFPLTTFQIVGARLQVCADAGFGGGQVGPAPCSALDLNQHWLFDPLTNHLVNEGTGECAASTAVGQPIVLQTCTVGSQGQQWTTYTVPDERGMRIVNVNPDPRFPDQGWATNGRDEAIELGFTTDSDNTFAWNFPLVQ